MKINYAEEMFLGFTAQGYLTEITCKCEICAELWLQINKDVILRMNDILKELESADLQDKTK
jgi:hypothetical protein